jgi:hypothetical protein
MKKNAKSDKSATVHVHKVQNAEAAVQDHDFEEPNQSIYPTVMTWIPCTISYINYSRNSCRKTVFQL